MPPSTPASAPTRPLLRDLAQTIHHATAAETGVHLVFVEHHDDDAELSLGFWSPPGSIDHPLTSLVGFRAPDRWDAVGVSGSGRRRDLAGDGIGSTASFTVLAHRSGSVASVLVPATATAEAPTVIEDPPTGWATDVLARVLGLPTPPPEVSSAIIVEDGWLDRIAAGVLDRPGCARSWRWLADRHPLRGPGPVPTPADLASTTTAHAERHPWSHLRSLAGSFDLPATSAGPPGGTILGADRWFDDGSLCRWMLQRLSPTELLLADLLAELPDDLGDALVDSLVAVAPPSR